MPKFRRLLKHFERLLNFFVPILINNKSKMEKVQEIKNTARLPRPETGGELDGGAATDWHCHATRQ